MPVIGKDKEATEEAKRRMQQRYEAIKQKIDEIRLALQKDKDKPLDQRTEIPYSAPIDLLFTYPGLERRYSEGCIDNLAKDIDKHGMIHKPLCTLYFENFQESNINAIYVTCGSLRVQASRLLGKQTVDVLIKYITQDEAFDLSISENDSRDELNPIDRAILFKNWQDRTGITQPEIAIKRNKTQAWVAQTFRLLTLPERIQELIRGRKVSINQANKILQINDEDEQIQLAELCAEGLSEKGLDVEIERRKLKAMSNNALLPPPVDKTPPEPYKPPSPSPKLIPPKPPIIQPKPGEVIRNNFIKFFDEQIKNIAGKEKEFNLYFPHFIRAIGYTIVKCHSECNTCGSQDARYICFPMLVTLEKRGISFEGIDYRLLKDRISRE